MIVLGNYIIPFLREHRPISTTLLRVLLTQQTKPSDNMINQHYPHTALFCCTHASRLSGGCPVNFSKLSSTSRGNSPPFSTALSIYTKNPAISSGTPASSKPCLLCSGVSFTWTISRPKCLLSVAATCKCGCQLMPLWMFG